MHADDARWIDERANKAAHLVGSQIRKELLDHYGPENFPVISLQGRYEGALLVEMTAAFERGMRLGKMEKSR
jgi:hypothetical protein